jgi:aminopeptidase N
MEEASDTNLEWFFRQWVFGAGSPKLEIKQTYSAKSRTLVVTIAQTQENDGITPAAVILPMELEIKTARGTKIEKLDIKNREEKFSYKLDGKPTATIFDKNEKIPLKTVKVQPLITVK